MSSTCMNCKIHGAQEQKPSIMVACLGCGRSMHSECILDWPQCAFAIMPNKILFLNKEYPTRLGLYWENNKTSTLI
uniref:Uncharacterized protein n=1 Tax=Ciona intestinalis TaxID=7719 RepID=H2XVN2_CIOIN